MVDLLTIKIVHILYPFGIINFGKSLSYFDIKGQSELNSMWELYTFARKTLVSHAYLSICDYITEFGDIQHRV